jgi:hypothetical protein
MSGLVENDLARRQRGHDGDAEAESAYEHRRSHRVSDKRSQATRNIAASSPPPAHREVPLRSRRKRLVMGDDHDRRAVGVHAPESAAISPLGILVGSLKGLNWGEGAGRFRGRARGNTLHRLPTLRGPVVRAVDRPTSSRSSPRSVRRRRRRRPGLRQLDVLGSSA